MSLICNVWESLLNPEGSAKSVDKQKTINGQLDQRLPNGGIAMGKIRKAIYLFIIWMKQMLCEMKSP